MSNVTVTSAAVIVKVPVAVDLTDLWVNTFAAYPQSFGSWIHSLEFKGHADWAKSGAVVVTLEDPEDPEQVVVKELIALDLAHALGNFKPAYASIARRLLDGTADCIDADALIQQAVLGDVVYG